MKMNTLGTSAQKSFFFLNSQHQRTWTVIDASSGVIYLFAIHLFASAAALFSGDGAGGDGAGV
jgi:hypothetical protein